MIETPSYDGGDLGTRLDTPYTSGTVVLSSMYSKDLREFTRAIAALFS